MCQVLAILEFVLSSHIFHGYHHRIRSVEYLLTIEGGGLEVGCRLVTWADGREGGELGKSGMTIRCAPHGNLETASYIDPPEGSGSCANARLASLTQRW